MRNLFVTLMMSFIFFGISVSVVQANNGQKLLCLGKKNFAPDIELDLRNITRLDIQHFSEAFSRNDGPDYAKFKMSETYQDKVQIEFDGMSSFKFRWKKPPNVNKGYVNTFSAKLLPNGRLISAERSHAYQWQCDKGRDEALEILANLENNKTPASDKIKSHSRNADKINKDEAAQILQSEKIGSAKNECQIIGYTVGTEKFADCVMQLIK